MIKVLYAISAILLVASGYMYWVMDKNQLHLQSLLINTLSKTADQNAVYKKNNPYVIRNGSNAMPEGMGQSDSGNNQQFMPQWQKDKIKDMSGDAQGKPGMSNQQPPPSPAPSTSQGGGVTPPTYNKSNSSGDIGTGSNSIP